jgi:hypothetical protein
MTVYTRSRLSAGTALLASLLVTSGALAQEVAVGHKLLGTLGIRAGVLQPAGVYVGARLIGYNATEVADRNGNRLPIGLNADALGGGFDFSATFEVKPLSTYVGAAVGISTARLDAHTENPRLDARRGGFSDLAVQPIRLGWRTHHFDILTSYGFYAPTGRFDPSGDVGLGQGQWTHELNLGGAVYFDQERTWYLSAVGSLDVNMRKRGIDLTRGTTIQVQGGAGKTLFRLLDVGIASYALWQVSDDSGADVPPNRVGARERAYGLGPEIGVGIPVIRGRLSARYVREVVSVSRPEGQVVMIGLAITAWQPPRHKPEASPPVRERQVGSASEH